MELSQQLPLTNWIENLAYEELNMDESGVVIMNQHLDPNILLEESSVNFMNALRDKVEIFIGKFNECRGGQSSINHVKIFKISNTINDFMLFRNSLRMVFARKSNDQISIGLLVNGKDLYAPRLTEFDAFGASNQTHDLKAHVGPFNRIIWKFQGEEIDLDAMVRHYLTEFIRHSAK
ncbi:MAG: hypothetical protein A2X86_05945 [Bdellovibrionales bacterium GWA2_49_15]|nr:MAG: hypothetical protein A2X86_05945 [Bdellovibrionales bacterium GWA2_49_15]